MKTSYRCTSVKEFNNMVNCIRSQLFTHIECIYNVGGAKHYECPLFIFAKEDVFRLYFSEGKLVLTVYDQAYFLAHREKDIFRDPEYPDEFDYIWPEVYRPNSQLCDIHSAKNCGIEQNLNGLDLVFADGKQLRIRESELVPYTMDSWII